MGYLINPFRYKIVEPIIFTTNKNGTFNPQISTSDVSVATWKVTGEADQTTNTPSFILDGTDRIVTLEIANFSKINFFLADNVGIKDILDIINIDNFDRVKIIFNSALTNVYFGNNSNTILSIFLYWNDLITVDVSGLINLGGDFRVSRNPNLTSILLPITNKQFTQFDAYNCAVGVIDWTKLTGSNNNIIIRIQNNSMSVAEVNENLVKIDNQGWINGTLDISGTNAAPDGSSGGFDGLTAKSNLIANGWSVTTN